jgi:hypothetical protein
MNKEMWNDTVDKTLHNNGCYGDKKAMIRNNLARQRLACKEDEVKNINLDILDEHRS